MDIVRAVVLMLLALPVVLTPLSSAAELVSHHGTTVNAGGSVKSCISCHDGSIGNPVSACTSKCKTSEEHAVLKRYPPRKKAEDYAPIGEVRAKGIRIVNGNVTCISCHNLRKNTKYHLINEDVEALCRVCHLKL